MPPDQGKLIRAHAAGDHGRKQSCPSSPHLRPIRTWPNARKRSSPRNPAAEVLLCDTGVLLAAGNVKDHAHQACLRLLRHAEGPLLVPSPVLGEIGYLLQSRAGPQAEVTFLRSSGGDGFRVAELQGAGTGRMAELAERYLDLPLGIVDAAVAAVAGRLGLTGIATLDHRHFTVIRPRHVQAFTLLPGAGHALS
jgi:predicted nucleic acid-binding protein